MRVKWKCLSGSALKVLAVLSMLTDHLAHFLWKDCTWAQMCLLQLGHRTVTPYFLMRAFGRLAFPIFAFLLVEGFGHTRSKKRYGLLLASFAVLSEIPWNLVHGGTWWHFPSQNVIFTLLLGFLGMLASEYFRDKDRFKEGLCLVGLLVAAFFLRADYGVTGYAFIMMLYFLRERFLYQAVVGSCFLTSRLFAGLAFIPLSMYNGRRGFIRGKAGKYFFYVFYPLHLLIIWLLM